MITITRSPDFDLGLSNGGTTVSGPRKLWMRKKTEGVARFHFVEFSTTRSDDANGIRSNIWSLEKGQEDGCNLKTTTKLVVVYMNSEPIFDCRVNLEKGQFISVKDHEEPASSTPPAETLPAVAAQPMFKAAVVTAPEAPKAKPVRKRTTTSRAKKEPVTA